MSVFKIRPILTFSFFCSTLSVVISIINLIIGITPLRIFSLCFSIIAFAVSLKSLISLYFRHKRFKEVIIDGEEFVSTEEDLMLMNSFFLSDISLSGHEYLERHAKDGDYDEQEK